MTNDTRATVAGDARKDALEWLNEASAKYEYDNFLKHPDVFKHLETIRVALQSPVAAAVDLEKLKREVSELICGGYNEHCLVCTDVCKVIDHLAASGGLK